MKAISTFLFLLFSTLAFSQVNWLKWNEAFDKTQDRNEFQLTFVLVSTDWCSHCQLQKRKMRKLYVEGIRFVELKAYTQESLNWKDLTYVPSPYSNNVHPVIERITNKSITSFPTWIILDEKMNLIQTIEGVIENEVFYQLSCSIIS